MVVAHGRGEGDAVASATVTGDGVGVCCVTVQSSDIEPHTPAAEPTF